MLLISARIEYLLISIIEILWNMLKFEENHSDKLKEIEGCDDLVFFVRCRIQSPVGHWLGSRSISFAC